MAKSKIKTLAIKLLSGAGTGFFYITTKNPKNVPQKLALMKVLSYRNYHHSFCISLVIPFAIVRSYRSEACFVYGDKIEVTWRSQLVIDTTYLVKVP